MEKIDITPLLRGICGLLKKDFGYSSHVPRATSPSFQLIVCTSSASSLASCYECLVQDDRVRQYENYMNLEENFRKNEQKLQQEIASVSQAGPLLLRMCL